METKEYNDLIEKIIKTESSIEDLSIAFGIIEDTKKKMQGIMLHVPEHQKNSPREWANAAGNVPMDDVLFSKDEAIQFGIARDVSSSIEIDLCRSTLERLKGEQGLKGKKEKKITLAQILNPTFLKSIAAQGYSSVRPEFVTEGINQFVEHVVDDYVYNLFGDGLAELNSFTRNVIVNDVAEKIIGKRVVPEPLKPTREELIRQLIL